MSRPEQAEGSQPQAVAGSVGVVRSRAVECARDCSAATATVADRPCSWHGQWRAGSVGAFGPGDGSCDDADARSAWCRCPATFPAGGWQHWWPGFAVELSGRGEYAADRKSNACEVVQQHSTGPAAVANTRYRERTARTETPALFAEITALNVSGTPRKAMTCTSGGSQPAVRDYRLAAAFRSRRVGPLAAIFVPSRQPTRHCNYAPPRLRVLSGWRNRCQRRGGRPRLFE